MRTRTLGYVYYQARCMEPLDVVELESECYLATASFAIKSSGVKSHSLRFASAMWYAMEMLLSPRIFPDQ